MDISLIYLPTAVALGALHALEPGHAKTLTAAYLIGTKGTRRDAIILGLSVAFTHSLIVIGLSVGAVLLGREAFTDEATHFLAVGSSVIVIVLGMWLLTGRIRALRPRRSLANSTPHRVDDHHHRAHHHDHGQHGHHGHGGHHGHHHHDHADDEENHHLGDLPEYVHRGERPTVWQIIAFGAAGGLVPCPSAISVMLLALSISEAGKGLLLVFGFSFGLALTLVGVGLLVVSGLTAVVASDRFSRFGRYAPALAAALVIFSGVLGLVVALAGHSH